MSSADEDRQSRPPGDAPDDRADALVLRAEALIRQGQLVAARQELDRASALHHERGRVLDEARTALLSASLWRLGGDPAEARVRAERAASLADPGTKLAVDASVELGEIGLAEHAYDRSVAAFSAALATATSMDLSAGVEGNLRRRRAVALANAGRYPDAAADLARAHDLLAQAGEDVAALRALIERASALHAAGTPDAEDAWRAALQAAEAVGDHGAQADLYLLQVARSISRGEVAAGMRAAQEARSQALAGRAPIPYVAAAKTIAELAERLGDRVAAYEALAVGWVTLGDLLGAQAGRAAFEPTLLQLRERWGATAFAAAKAAYEDRRRAALGGATR